MNVLIVLLIILVIFLAIVESRRVNFDNAASTEPFKEVQDTIAVVSSLYSSIHRGSSYRSRFCTSQFEKTREIIKKYVNAMNNDSCIFTGNATCSINLIASKFHEKFSTGTVLVTEMEHHSNILPWRKYFNVKYIEINQLGRVSLKSLLKLMTPDVICVSICGCSNVTGIINPISEISKIVHSFGVQLVVDAAQLIPHRKIDCLEQGIDYLAFSSHKIYCPYGIGVVVGKRDILEGNPTLRGGGEVEYVSKTEVIWKRNEEKEEAGSQNVIGVIALGKAIEVLSKKIENFDEDSLTKHLVNELKTIPQIIIYGDEARDVPLVSFRVKGRRSDVISDILDKKYSVANRCGCFCAQIYVRKLLGFRDDFHGRFSLVRVSLGLGNTINQINYFIKALKEIVNN